MEIPQDLIIGFCDAIVTGALEYRDLFESKIQEEGGEIPNFKCLTTEDLENISREASIIKEEKSKRKLNKPTWVYKKPIRENKVIVCYENVVKNKTAWVSFSPDAKIFIKHFLATIRSEVGIYYQEGGNLIDCITMNSENAVLLVLSELPINTRTNIRCKLFENKMMGFLSTSFPKIVNIDTNTLVSTYIGNFIKYAIGVVVSLSWKSKCKITSVTMEKIFRGISIHSKSDFSEVWFIEINSEIFSEIKKQKQKKQIAKKAKPAKTVCKIVIDTKDEPEDADEDDEEYDEEDEEDDEDDFEHS